MSHLPLGNLKKSLANRIQKICFYLCKDEEYHPSLLKGLADSVSKIYELCDVHHVYMCRFCKSVIFIFAMYIYMCDIFKFNLLANLVGKE